MAARAEDTGSLTSIAIGLANIGALLSMAIDLENSMAAHLEDAPSAVSEDTASIAESGPVAAAARVERERVL
jgi:hypothetical protein